MVMEKGIEPKSGIKAQTLAEVVNETTLGEQDGGNWLLHVDGSSTFTANGVGVVLISPEGDEMKYALHINFKASNNEAKYESLIASIRIAFACSDSRLVTNQVIEGFKIGVPSRASNNASRSLPILKLTQVEVTDRILVQGIKTKLEQASGQWVDAYLSVLWL
ncbi:UNVERIFIED_CONTAM: hypothetical protein Scaly_1647100 [Sesamum calycinum]|uniref:Reverse transcriptase domain-containing protein n=1 Tax=Sesamum calycinum TaxID=2727403 RepID=A0AAW2PCR5_9LAMI